MSHSVGIEIKTEEYLPSPPESEKSPTLTSLIISVEILATAEKTSKLKVQGFNFKPLCWKVLAQ